VAGGSDWIVTEDKDLLRLGAFEQIRNVRGAHFMKVALNS
jgi:predicted nucleic acid-binding protein